jgi:hypothetical protein
MKSDGRGNLLLKSFYTTSKYSLRDGSLLWESGIDWRLPDPIVAVDSNGDVIVSGAAVGFFSCDSGKGVFTTKYAGGNGARLWEQGYSQMYGIQATSTALDASGNVIVTATGNTNWVNFETFALKYPATGGEPLWKLICGPVRRPDYLHERNLAVGPNGSIAVILNTDNDFTIVNYVMTQVTYPTPVVLSLALSSEGARLRFTGDAGRTYRLQRTLDPSGPWSTFAALTAPPDGAVEHLDPTPLASPAFYRIAAP